MSEQTAVNQAETTADAGKLAALPPVPPPPGGPIDFTPIKERLQRAIDEHSPSLDAWCFNGGTLLTLTFTAASALFSSQAFGEKLTFVAAILSSVAGVLVAAERALAFGARWRFHHEMRSGYRSIVDMIDFAALLPDGPEKAKYTKDIWTALYALRSRESAIPGSGTTPQ
ncbi:hypothetical protein [Propionivibrio sp.]|uniref:hypothetical protein n=1 Tax=Propionivibrio sp. TaxID=2212460 RepID=UPI0025E5C6B4|nr:hypothetical protein [Propionivibrio sp.]MBK7357180.1 hypothetical protein [Propionivibrio sp.]